MELLMGSIPFFTGIFEKNSHKDMKIIAEKL
jgi:hypothetical protein